MLHLIKHFNTVIKHKWFVLVYGRRLHIFWTALVHDTSKFSPTEFIRSAKYYTGVKSPTILEREDNDGVSWICLHHSLRNKHHWQAYIDYNKEGMVIAPINYRHSVEYVADIISASRVYNKKLDWTEIVPYFERQKERYLMHPGNKEFVLWAVIEIRDHGFKSMKKKYMKNKYNEIMAKYSYSVRIPLDKEFFRPTAIKE